MNTKLENTISSIRSPYQELVRDKIKKNNEKPSSVWASFFRLIFIYGANLVEIALLVYVILYAGNQIYASVVILFNWITSIIAILSIGMIAIYTRIHVLLPRNSDKHKIVDDLLLRKNMIEYLSSSNMATVIYNDTTHVIILILIFNSHRSTDSYVLGLMFILLKYIKHFTSVQFYKKYIQTFDN